MNRAEALACLQLAAMRLTDLNAYPAHFQTLARSAVEGGNPYRAQRVALLFLEVLQRIEAGRRGQA